MDRECAVERNCVDRGKLVGLLSDTLMLSARLHFRRACFRVRSLGWVLIPLFVLPVCVSVIPARAQTPAASLQEKKREARHEIDRLEEAWRTVTLNGDVAALDRLMADDYQGITAFGTVETKDEMLARFRTGQRHITTLNIADRKVRFYGKTAVVTSYAGVEGTNAAGENVSGSGVLDSVNGRTVGCLRCRRLLAEFTRV